jgi:hypothetical protein
MALESAESTLMGLQYGKVLVSLFLVMGIIFEVFQAAG